MLRSVRFAHVTARSLRSHTKTPDRFASLTNSTIAKIAHKNTRSIRSGVFVLTSPRRLSKKVQQLFLFGEKFFMLFGSVDLFFADLRKLLDFFAQTHWIGRSTRSDR